jgi:hypothetical protein
MNRVEGEVCFGGGVSPDEERGPGYDDDDGYFVC